MKSVLKGLTGRSSSLSSLTSTTVMNNNIDDTFDFDQATLDLIRLSDNYNELIEIYYASR